MHMKCGTVGEQGVIMPQPLPLTSERLERHGLFLIEDGQTIFLWVGRDAVPPPGSPALQGRVPHHTSDLDHSETSMSHGNEPSQPFHATTILMVKREGLTVIGGDGQVSFGQTVMKSTARKVRRSPESMRAGRDGWPSDWKQDLCWACRPLARLIKACAVRCIACRHVPCKPES